MFVYSLQRTYTGLQDGTGQITPVWPVWWWQTRLFARAARLIAVASCCVLMLRDLKVACFKLPFVGPRAGFLRRGMSA